MKKEIIAENKKHLQELIKECIEREGQECDLNHIDTSQITHMSNLFEKSNFNGDISRWDVSQVNNMNGMFSHSQFNGDISEWNVSNVTSMYGMFEGSRFNDDISKWNVSNVENISDIFNNCNIDKVPYWAKIEDFKKRQKAVIEYQEILKNKQQLEKLITNNNSEHIIHKI